MISLILQKSNPWGVINSKQVSSEWTICWMWLKNLLKYLIQMSNSESYQQNLQIRSNSLDFFGISTNIWHLHQKISIFGPASNIWHLHWYFDISTKKLPSPLKQKNENPPSPNATLWIIYQKSFPIYSYLHLLSFC
jgi:hypothetical protein